MPSANNSRTEALAKRSDVFAALAAASFAGIAPWTLTWQPVFSSRLLSEACYRGVFIAAISLGITRGVANVTLAGIGRAVAPVRCGSRGTSEPFQRTIVTISAVVAGWFTHLTRTNWGSNAAAKNVNWLHQRRTMPGLVPEFPRSMGFFATCP